MSNDTLNILLEARETVASAFNEEYQHIVYKKTEVSPEGDLGYHLTGLDMGYKNRSPEVQIRMQIKEGIDEERKIHYARHIPKDYLDATLVTAEYLKDEANKNRYQGFSVQGRHPHLDMRLDRISFKIPTQGIGIHTTFENPGKVARELLEIDRLIINNMCTLDTDPRIMKLLEKLNKEHFYNP